MPKNIQTDQVFTLGPSGSYHELSLNRFLQEQTVRKVLLSSFEQLFEQAEVGEYIWMAVENSLSGLVFDNLDIIQRRRYHVLDKYVFPIQLALAENLQTGVARSVFTHPKAAEEAAGFLKLHYPKARVNLTRSTAEAARYVAKLNEKAIAICHPATAKQYGLKLLKDEILNGEKNETTFFLIKK